MTRSACKLQARNRVKKLKEVKGFSYWAFVFQLNINYPLCFKPYQPLVAGF